MLLRRITRDPMPEAERGTLEYAASAAACTAGYDVLLSLEEAGRLRNALVQLCHRNINVDPLMLELRRLLEGALPKGEDS